MYLFNLRYTFKYPKNNINLQNFYNKHFYYFRIISFKFYIYIMSKTKDTTLNTLNNIIEAIKEKKGKNICSLNFEKISNSICDYFVICEADNRPMVEAIVDEIEKQVKQNNNVRPHHVEGMENATWVLIDYFDVIVHIFQDDYRNFYNLEKLWADAEIINYS